MDRGRGRELEWPAMASMQLLYILALLLQLAFGSTYANQSQHISSKPLHDNSSTDGASNVVGRSDDLPNAVGSSRDYRSKATFSTEPSSRLKSLRSGPMVPPPVPSSWELELAPYLLDMSPPRDPNTTLLRGPPRLVGVFKGTWIRAAYGKALQPQDLLSSEQGVIVLRLPEEPLHSAVYDDSGVRAERLQELRGEMVIRDGDSVTDHDLRFRIKGTYVAAAGTVHAVLEPHPPWMLKAELENKQFSDGAGRGDSQELGGTGSGQWQLGDTATVAAATSGREAFAGGSRGTGSGVRGGGTGAEKVGDAESSGYREALRTAARNLVLLGPAWHRTLVRASPPRPPSPGRATSRRRRAGEDSEQLSLPPSSQLSPRPPLELALMQNCELRADFRVYYKGDPEAKSHVQFLGLDQPPSPTRAPSLKPTAMALSPSITELSGGDGGATTGEPVRLPSVAAATRPASVNLNAAPVRQLRRLAADTEIYHSTQMQLHADTTAVAATAVGSGDGAAVGGVTAAQDSVYGIPAGMDPLDPDLELIGIVVSPNCEFTLHFNASSIHLERYYRQAVRYSGLVATVTIAQIVLSVSQSEAASTPSAAARMSLYSVTLQAILDAYQCLLHLTGALVVDALFAAFASIAFLQFLLFAVFEMRQTLLVWRAQRVNGNGGDFWTVRRDMSAVYFRFYGLLLLGLLLMFQFRSHLALMVLLLHSWWLPQLIHSARSDTRPPLKAEYVWGMSALRLVSPLYFYGCPSNLLRVEQHSGVCVALVVWVGLQAALVIAQIQLGPRVFIPRIFLPQLYDYHRPATKREMGIEEPQSASAAMPGTLSASLLASSAEAMTGSGWWHWVNPSGRPALLRRLTSWLTSAFAWFRRPSGFSAGHSVAAAAAAVLQSAAGAGGRCGGEGTGPDDADVETGHGSKECVICMNPVPLLPFNARMLTPCGHFFHERCLTRWMEVKMDCPTCRRPLPPV
ncbi:hypothetical protein VaNZ11_012511 [Volvox africanus]|uniref:RING-type E3 ubiquitin transferase n=1 Tax=Volvox africanus TaxID=51714 RepID=A0ABQ5SEU0_9CHLO|nr:hypothetical protein VaNZ11_012511 [Volvox africanus]